MAYIVVLNPLIIGTQPDSTGAFLGGGDAPNLKMVAATTALVAGVMTLAMGIVANYPLALAAGLGLNAFVTFGIAKLPGMTWADAMGLVVLEGIIITILVLTGFRQAVLHAVPAQLKVAISVGIGLFIAIIGFVDAGFVRKSFGGPLGELGVGGFLAGWPLLVFVVGLFAIITMMVRHVKGAILYGIIGATAFAVLIEAIAKIGPQKDATGTLVNATGWGLNVPAFPDALARVPDFGLLGQFSLLGSFSAIGFVSAALLVFILTLFDVRLVPPPEGTGTGAASLLTVPGERVFGKCLVEHLLHRVRFGCRRGGAHWSRLSRHRLALPAGHLLCPARGDGPLRGGHTRSRCRGLPHDAAGQGDRLG